MPNRAFEPVRFRYRQRETMERHGAAAETRPVGPLGRLRWVASHPKEDRSDEPRFYVCHYWHGELSYRLGRRQWRSEWRRAMRTPKGRWAARRMNCETKPGSADTGLGSLQPTARHANAPGGWGKWLKAQLQTVGDVSRPVQGEAWAALSYFALAELTQGRSTQALVDLWVSHLRP